MLYLGTFEMIKNQTTLVQSNIVKLDAVKDMASGDSIDESLNSILDKFKETKIEVSLEHGMDISK